VPPSGGTDFIGDNMTRAPRFWCYNDLAARILSPFSRIAAVIAAYRIARSGWTAPVPVICCGNATVGGAGKTILVQDLANRLTARGIAVHILLRGYRGRSRSVRRVALNDSSAVTGDEALLLASSVPTWTGADRAAGARAAIAEGAKILLMDDGLQNSALTKTMSLLAIDGSTGFGNNRVLPAGPLREPVIAAASRCRAAVLIGSDVSGAMARLPPGLPVLGARLKQSQEVTSIKGRRVVAFTGIAIPSKFFAGLEYEGVVLAAREYFPDHHAFTHNEVVRLDLCAKVLGAVLVTTPKDAVRLPRGISVRVVSVELIWDSDAAIDMLLDELVMLPAKYSPNDGDRVM
jgi:tetraacyldisaccharide 4'-kinase